MPDPYDTSKSWSVKVEVESAAQGTCAGGRCDADDVDESTSVQADKSGVHGIPDGYGGSATVGLVSDPDSQAINPLYPYDNCIITEEGPLVINGAASNCHQTVKRNVLHILPAHHNQCRNTGLRHRDTRRGCRG